MKKNTLLLLSLFFVVKSFATEGMWLPQLLQTLNESEMQSMGLKLTARDIYDINNGSLKDAIVQFGGGCTGEIISDQGLVLTNHHCGFDNIQEHSTLEHNYLETGFWARNKSEELPNPGLAVTFIVRIDDVTEQVLAGVNSGISEKERQTIIVANIKKTIAGTVKEQWQDAFIRAFYEGNKYYLFIKEVYSDVRLVGAPPSAIGKFGNDTDNWVWPRHNADFSMFRIYADKNNRPAPYSKDNVPFKPRRSLSISLDGISKDDFTMVFGFPGRTQEYLYSAAIEQNLKVLNPAKIEIRDRTLKVWDGYMRKDAKVKIQYASKYAGVANAWKKWIGENLGLKKTNAVDKRKQFENLFQQKVSADNALNQKYGNIFNDFSTAYTYYEQYALARDLYNETMRATELLPFTRRFDSLIYNYGKSDTVYNRVKNNLKKSLSDFYKDYVAVIDKDVCYSIMPFMVEKMPSGFFSGELETQIKGNSLIQNIDYIYDNSIFVNAEKTEALFNKPDAELVNTIKTDPAYKAMSMLDDAYSLFMGNKLATLQNKIDLLQRTYMAAQMEVFKDKRFYPNANSTLRLSYGKVDGFSPRDAVSYNYFTTLDGVMEKYIPGDYEFDVPEKLRELYKNKDYGQYGMNGKMPVCFIAANHTTGGNSGSPALDGYGNLIGLNFDRAWEGTMSDINYDASICRNIMVDARYVLFIIDKFAGATNLIEEMKLVHPKNEKIKPKKTIMKK